MLSGAKYDIRNVDGFILLGALVENPITGEEFFYPFCGWDDMDSFRLFSIQCDKFMSEHITRVPDVFLKSLEEE